MQNYAILTDGFLYILSIQHCLREVGGVMIVDVFVILQYVYWDVE